MNHGAKPVRKLAQYEPGLMEKRGLTYPNIQFQPSAALSGTISFGFSLPLQAFFADFFFFKSSRAGFRSLKMSMGSFSPDTGSLCTAVPSGPFLAPQKLSVPASLSTMTCSPFRLYYSLIVSDSSSAEELSSCSSITVKRSVVSASSFSTNGTLSFDQHVFGPCPNFPPLTPCDYGLGCSDI